MDLRQDLSFFKLIADSYCRLTGQSIVPSGMTIEEAAKWLYEDAPFAILAHDTAPDPVFVYGNRAAQRLFEYEWEELTQLPSRLSAEAPERSERQRFLQRVERDRFVTGYCGVRITKSGKPFRIENATIWQLIDANGACHGQAAMLPQTPVSAVFRSLRRDDSVWLAGSQPMSPSMMPNGKLGLSHRKLLSVTDRSRSQGRLLPAFRTSSQSGPAFANHRAAEIGSFRVWRKWRNCRNCRNYVLVSRECSLRFQYVTNGAWFAVLGFNTRIGQATK